jgi:hypothetical protein
MSKISWGKPTIEIAVIGAAGTPGIFTALPAPVKDTTQLTVEKGEKLEAPLEGGEMADVRYSRNKYTLVFELYKTKGQAKPIADSDGIITEEYAVRLTPEDPTNEGFIIDRATVSVEDTWAANIGYKWKYTFEALKPENGAMLKPYTAPNN